MVSAASIHPTAHVDDGAQIGAGTFVWHNCHVRAGAVVGSECVLGKDVYIDAGVHVGDRAKIQNGVSVFAGVTIERGVFCGPHAVFTNDLHPRAITPDGELQGAADWEIAETLVREGASIGANSTIVCGITIGRWAAIGAGSVVTRDVPDHGLVYGNPARLRGHVCMCGARLADAPLDPGTYRCPACGADVVIA
jgi:acetyltransferase-like isoleucine patch superfamily enzyme